MKRLDQKIANILRVPSGAKDFIIADAKDADMACGITAPGSQTGACRHGYNESDGCWKTFWHPGHHDNPFGLPLTALMISKHLPDSSVPTSLLADHPDVHFQYLRSGFGRFEVEMH
jgi:hypothetical protein